MTQLHTQADRLPSRGARSSWVTDRRWFPTIGIGSWLRLRARHPRRGRQMGGVSKRFLALGWCGRPMAVPRPHDLAASDEPSPSPALTLTHARRHGTPSVRCRSAGERPLEQRPARRVPSSGRCSRPARWSFPGSRALDRCGRLRAMPSETRPSPHETDGSTSVETCVPGSRACRGRAEVQGFRASNREGGRVGRRSRLA